MILANSLVSCKGDVNSLANPHLAEPPSQIDPSRVRAARKAGGFTQASAAAALGVHEITVNRWENGKLAPPGEMLLRMAQLYAVTVEQLVGQKAAANDGERGMVPRETSQSAKRMSRLARNLPLAVREYLAELRLRLTKGGAAEEEIEEAMDLLRSPSVFSFYKGGAPSEYNEHDVLRGMKALAEGVIIPELRDRGRKIQ